MTNLRGQFFVCGLLVSIQNIFHGSYKAMLHHLVS